MPPEWLWCASLIEIGIVYVPLYAVDSGVLYCSAATESQSASRSVSVSLSVADPPATSARYHGKFVQLVPLMQPVCKGNSTQPTADTAHGTVSRPHCVNVLNCELSLD